MTAADAERERRIAACVERALELHDRGDAIDLRVICAAAPELADEVAGALALAGALPQLWSDDGDARLGSVIAGRYRLLRRLGAGAMGAVYAAHDAALDREVALKLLQPELQARGSLHERFQREAQALGALRHPAIVTVHDRGMTPDGLPFLVMDRLEGRPLSALLLAATAPGARPFDDPAALASELGARLAESGYLRFLVRLGAELADGLAAAHAAGITHRDVKPSNVFVTTSGQPVLLDFGIAARAADAELTVPGTALGTPIYMAPEQAAGRARNEAALDVYGLGATLYHLLTLRAPYDGDRMQVLAQLAHRDPLPPGRANPRLPRDLVAILERAIERDPKRRYASAAALAADLRAFLEHRPVGVRPLGPVGRLVRRVRRQPVHTLAAAALGSVLLLGGLLGWWLHDESQRRAARELRARLAELGGYVPIEGLPDRLPLVDPARRAAALADLDRILALAPDDLLARWLRAATRLDAGLPDAAREDLATLAGGGEYAAALARACASAESSQQMLRAALAAELPEPDGAGERTIAAFHELVRRGRDAAARAEAWLAGLDAPVFAAELHALSLLVLGESAAARERAQQVELALGAPSVRTRHVLGATLLSQRRYVDAIPVLRDAIRMRPEWSGPKINLGVALKGSNRLDAAAELLREVVAAQPWQANARTTLVQVLAESERFAEARAVAEAAGSDGALGPVWQRAYLLGVIALGEALAARLHGEAGAAAGVARDAAAALDAAGRAGAPARMLQTPAKLAAAVAAADREAVLVALFELLADEPLNAFRLELLAAELRDPALASRAPALVRSWLPFVEGLVRLSFDFATEPESDSGPSHRSADPSRR